METQKTHRRKIAVALLAGMLLAMPFFSMTAEAQQTQQARRQGAPRGRGTPAEVAPRALHSTARDKDRYVSDGLDGQYGSGQRQPEQQQQRPQQNQLQLPPPSMTRMTPRGLQLLQQLDRN